VSGTAPESTGGRGDLPAPISDVVAYYDDAAPAHLQRAFNERHRHLLRLLVRLGLKPDSSVLEVGCGVGAITALMARRVPRGRIVGLDLSPRSIEIARRLVGSAANVSLRVGDVCSMSLGADQFDFVTLFDVLEHIPLERHAALFERLAGVLAPSGLIVVNVPSPEYQEYLERHEPARLQLIDLKVPLMQLLACAAPAGLRLREYARSALWGRYDYEHAVFARGLAFVPDPPPRPVGRLRRGLAGLLGRLRPLRARRC
jgi:ubiquinone/menaquinone biosynthesis C-methylase UbiE